MRYVGAAGISRPAKGLGRFEMRHLILAIGVLAAACAVAVSGGGLF